MLIAEELLLVCTDPGTGRSTLRSNRLDPGLSGALLAELALRERIGITAPDSGRGQRGRVTITSLTPTDDVELDLALDTLDEREGKKAKDLVSSTWLRPLSKGLRERLLRRLVDAGVLEERSSKVLGLVPHTWWPARDLEPGEEIRQRLHSALVAGLTPTERTVSLIALLEATDHLTKVVDTEDRRDLKARAKALTAGDWVAKAVSQAIQEAAAVAASAAT